ncbi:MAG: serine/threonine protein kinase [Deltaproteobacteria bacterium]|nr:serine/threonine protein kinase [Deltaproteobacteria bacterium]
MLDSATLSLDHVSAVDAADLLLLAAARRKATSLLIEPVGGAHAVTLERGSTPLAVAALPLHLGDAVIARLAIIAGLDVIAPDEQLGRIRLHVDDGESEFLVIVRAISDGLGAELRRIASHEDLAHAIAEPSAPMSLLQTMRIGIYRVHGELGRGGMGVVYRGEHGLLGRPVAIKVLYAELAKDPEIAARFVREARAASRARHPGIVDVLDFGTLPDGRAFLVMEVVEGTTLDVVLKKGALPPLRALNIARQIASALDASHGSGVVHRDLKPANVFVCEEDRIKIGDFGAAKLVGPGAGGLSDTQRGAIFGTPYYMSPEHARGVSTDRRTDIYAVGCVLFEMLAGRVPYDGETPVDILTNHITAPIPTLESPFGPLPDVLERAVTRAMAKRPEERYQTAQEMVADLDRALGALSRTGWRRWLPT